MRRLGAAGALLVCLTAVVVGDAAAVDPLVLNMADQSVAEPSITSVSDASVTEGNTGTTPANFTVQLSAPSRKPVTVRYSTENGSAIAPADYEAATNASITIPAGEPTGTITVNVNGDTIVEGNEFFLVNLTGADNATLSGDTLGRGDITDDDTAPSPPAVTSIGSPTVTEGNSGTVAASFLVTLSKNAPAPVEIRYSTANGSATAPDDYGPATNATLSIPTGSSEGTITIQVNGDTLPEGSGDPRSENFYVDLQSATGATLGSDTRGTGTITDDDTPPTVTSISDATVTEGNSGTVAANFVVTLSGNAPAPVAIRYSTTNGSATAPDDYTGASNATLNIPAGSNQGTIVIQVKGDTLPEGSGDPRSENFYVDLQSATGATLGSDTRGTGTITDDDTPPTVTSISDPTVTEGNSGTVAANFVVTLSGNAPTPVAILYSTLDGTARAPDDYTAASNQTLNIPAGSSQGTIVIQVKGDTLPEGANENFFVDLLSATGATLGSDTRGTGTITDDDAQRAVTIEDAGVTEGDGGTINLNFTVRLSGQTGQRVEVTVSTQDGSAVAPTDYQANTQVLVWAANTTALEKTFTVVVKGDVLDEADETLTARLSNVGGATIADSEAVGTITDNDNKSMLAISNAEANEGAAGVNSTMTFKVTLAPASARTVNIAWATANGTATAGSDYTAAGGTLTFAPGETEKSIAVAVLGDDLNEENETVLVNLSGASGAGVADAQGLGTIVDKNAPPSLSIDDPFARESEGATFTVTLAGTTQRTVTVTFSTGDGSAREGSDYSGRRGTLTFAPGEKTKTVAVTVLDDTVAEGPETFSVNLGDPVNAVITKSRGTATIEASDQATTAGVNPPPTPTPPPNATVPKPPGANPKTVFPRMVLGPRSMTLTAVGRARMQIACAKTSRIACVGVLSLENTAKKPLVLGKRSFAVKKGKQIYVPITLSDRAFGLVQKRKTLQVRAVVFIKTGGKTYRIVVPGIILIKATKTPQPRVAVEP